MHASRRDRRSALLAAATDLFLERGFEGATLDAIIERVGGSRRSIYAWFGDKEGLLEEIVRQHCAAARERFEALPLDGEPPRSMLVAIARFAAEGMLSPEGVKFHRLITQESARRPDLGELVYCAGVAPIQGRVKALVRAEHAAGRLWCPDPDIVARCFFGMVKCDLQLRTLYAVDQPLSAEEITAHAEAVVDLLLRGLAPRSGGV